MLVSQGRPIAEAVRTIGVTEVTDHRWRSEYGGLKGDQVKRLKELETENKQLRRAVSDLTLEKLILKEAACKLVSPEPAALTVWIMSLPRRCFPLRRGARSFQLVHTAHDTNVRDVAAALTAAIIAFAYRVPPLGFDGSSHVRDAGCVFYIKRLARI